MVAVEVDAGKVDFSLIDAGNDEVVVEWVLVVPLLVAEACEVVGVVIDGVGDVVVEEESLVGEFFEFAGGFLEVCELTGGGHDDVVGDLFVAVDADVL